MAKAKDSKKVMTKKETKKPMAKAKKPALVKKEMPTPAKPVKMSKQEERWQIESDARTLMQAEEIKNDSKRFNSAKGIVAQQVESGKKIITGE